MSTGQASGVVLAAGRSLRAGGAKALARLDGVPFVRRAVDALRGGGCGDVVVVTRAALMPEISALGLPATLAENPNPERGMLSSVQCGLSRVQHDAVLISLVDHPRVEASTVHLLIDAMANQDADVLRPKLGLRTGHPVLARGPALEAIRNADPSRSLRDVLSQFRCADVAVDDAGVLDDWDTLSDIVGGGGTLG